MYALKYFYKDSTEPTVGLARFQSYTSAKELRDKTLQKNNHEDYVYTEIQIVEVDESGMEKSTDPVSGNLNSLVFPITADTYMFYYVSNGGGDCLTLIKRFAHPAEAVRFAMKELGTSWKGSGIEVFRYYREDDFPAGWYKIQSLSVPDWN